MSRITAMDPSTRLLSVLAVLFIDVLFAIPMLEGGLEPRWVLCYFTVLAFYGALYFRRRLWLRHQRGGLYRGLGYAAVTLGASLLYLFFSGVNNGVPLPLAIAVLLVLAIIAAYFLYRIIVLHLDEEEGPQVQVQVDGAVRAPV